MTRLSRLGGEGFLKQFISILLLADNRERNLLLTGIQSTDLLRGKFFKAYQNTSLKDLGMRRILVNKNATQRELVHAAARIIDICYEHIREFNHIRNEYERCLAACDVERGLECLDCIERKTGFSFWALGQRLLLLSMRDTRAANDYLVQCARKVDGRNVFLFLLDHLKTLADLDVSYTKYLNDLEKHLSSTAAEARRYIEAKLRVDKLMDRADAALILQIDLQVSLIDFYLSYEAYLLSLGEAVFRSEDVGIIDEVLPKHDVGSSIIRNVSVLIGRDVTACDTESVEVYGIIELYSLGRYDAVIDACRSYLAKVPQDFQISCLLSKSYIRLGRTPLDDEFPHYVRCLYSLYSYDEMLDDALTWLQTEVRRCHGIGLSTKIRSFLLRKHIVGGDNPFHYPAFLLDKAIHPNCMRQLAACRQSAALQYFERVCPVSTESIVGVLSGDPQQCTRSADPIMNSASKVQAFCKAMLLSAAEEQLQELRVLCHGKGPYFIERCLRIDLLYLRKANRYLDAVRRLVNAYFEDERIFWRVLSKSEIRLDYRSRDEAVMRDVNHIVLTYLMYPTDMGKQIIVYDNFLDSNGIAHVSDCSALAVGAESEKVRFFLARVCTIGLLRMDGRLYEDGISPEQERIRILRYLDETSPHKSHADEMFEIRKRESIRKKLKVIKSGKINVDIDKILGLRCDDWEESFQSFLDVRALDEDSRFVLYPDDEESIGFDDRPRANRGLRVVSAQELTQRIMFDLVADMANELLYNPQYGLETYLSARIRHGYCKGQLITFLQNLGLIAIYDKSVGTYAIDTYWMNACDSDGMVFDVVREQVVHITKTVEDMVSEILSSWLRIRASASQKGVFDYTLLFDERTITHYLSIMEDHCEFGRLWRELVDSFWFLTELSLRTIRKRIDEELRSRYQRLLDYVISRISASDCARNSTLEELYRRCQKAKGEAEVALREFSDAFVHTGSDYQDFTLDELGECVQQTILRQYGVDAMRWTIEADNQHCLRGDYFLPFVDVLCILVGNAIEHSGIGEEEVLKVDVRMGFVRKSDLNVEVATDKMEGCESFVSIQVGNNLGVALVPSKVESELHEAFASISSAGEGSELMQSEGGTGLHKLCKIIEYQISWQYYTEYSVGPSDVTIGCVMCADNLLRGGPGEDTSDRR